MDTQDVDNLAEIYVRIIMQIRQLFHNRHGARIIFADF